MKNLNLSTKNKTCIKRKKYSEKIGAPKLYKEQTDKNKTDGR